VGGNKRKKRKKRNEKRQTIDTQAFALFRFYSVFPFSVPFGGVIGSVFYAVRVPLS
jgi:hypothetical protein